jgi:hypothetical protein
LLSSSSQPVAVRINVATMSVTRSLCTDMCSPAINEASENVLQRKAQATLFHERHDGQQQGDRNESEYNVSQN